MPNFEVYQRQYGGSRKQRGASVTVTSRGGMYFSEDAWAAIGLTEAVKFLVDKNPQERLVGFQACAQGEQGAHRALRGSRTVSAVPLLRYLRHDLSVSRRYTLHVEDGLPPYIDLDEDAPVVTSNRRKKGKGKS